MSVVTQHPVRAAGIAFAAVAIAVLAFNGPVAAGESADVNDPATAVTEVVGDVAPMIEPMEDVDESDATGDLAPMIEPMEDVDE